MLVFDWCHDLLSSDQRRMLVDRWNGVTDTLNRKEWGGPGLEGNNYYWGYLRNGLEWGIASFHENPRAAELIDHAVNERYRKGFVPFANGPGRGAVLGEGTQYGPYILRYATIPFVTAAQQGVDLWNASDFFKEAVFYLLHATTPAPTVGAAGGEPQLRGLPVQRRREVAVRRLRRAAGAGHVHAGGGRAMGRPAPVGAYARGWLAQVKPRVPDIGRPPRPPSGRRGFHRPAARLLRDGAGFSTAATSGAGRDGPAGAARPPAARRARTRRLGKFQLWRAGRWLTRETVSYGEPIANWGGTATGGDQTRPPPDRPQRRLFEGMGPRTVGTARGPPHLVRLTSQPSVLSTRRST